MFIMALYRYSYFYYLYQNCTNYTISQGGMVRLWHVVQM